MLSYDDLRPYQGSRKLAEARDLKKSESFSVSNKIFLSHRHDDKDWVASVVAYLSDHGIDVYIDSNDPSAPKKTSVETAKLIQKRISECKKFLVLAWKADGSLWSNSLGISTYWNNQSDRLWRQVECTSC